MIRSSCIVGAWLLALLDLVPLAAQESPTVFTDRVDVEVVNVEVFVTDAQGQAVRGLTRDDFVILEDGVEVEITNFYSVHPEPDQAQPATARSPRAIESGRTAPGPASERQQVDVPEQRLNLLIYLDNFNIRPVNRARVLASLGDFLANSLADGARIMFVVHDQSLRVTLPLTDDTNEVAAALEALNATSTSGQESDAQGKIAARRIAQTLRDPRTADSAGVHLDRFVQSERERLERSTRALRSAVRSLAGIPGRKALLYVGDGLPLRPGARLARQFFGAVGGPGEGRLFSLIAREANAQQVTFYALDARGAAGWQSISSEYDEIEAGGSLRGALDAEEMFNAQEPLINMAVATGGRTILNTFDFAAGLADLGTDFESFYSLGFESGHPGDGRYHRIEVRVRQPGLRLRHRSGFLAKPPEERVGDRTLAALLSGRHSNPLGLQVELAEAGKKGRRKYLLPILVRIPVRKLTLLPDGDSARGRLRVYLAVQDEMGDLADLHQELYPVSLTARQAASASGEIAYAKTLLIRPGVATLAVGVWDEVSGIESFVARSVTVGRSGK